MTRADKRLETHEFPAVLVFLVSAAGMAYELALMRILSIAQWHHFAYMVISMAMLGFGAGGTVLALLRGRTRSREREFFWATCLVFMFSLPACYAASQRVPFETFELVSQRVQLLYLCELYLVLAVPFLLASVGIALGFAMQPSRVGRVYFCSMAGSAVGAVTVVGLMYLVAPKDLPWLIAVPIGAAWVVGEPGSLRGVMSRGLAVLLLLALGLAFGRPPVRMSQYKGLSYALQYPDAEIVAIQHSPLSEITAVSSKRIRETPGQIANYPMRRLGPLPEQIGLFHDGMGPSVINHFQGNVDEVAYLDYVTAAVPYRLLSHPRVLVLGLGGGTDVLMAMLHSARAITAVEVDRKVAALLDTTFDAFSGGITTRRPEVNVVVADGREFLRRDDGRYDLIQLALLDSFNASAAGVHALSENYLYTVEAIDLYLSRLTPGGILSITRWLKTPPRDAVKMFATLVEACERAGWEEPRNRLAFIRSWNTATLLLSRTPFSAGQVEALKAFCDERSFDLCYYPGMRAEEANHSTVLERPFYFDAAQAILSMDREAFYHTHLFNVRPATDDRPHFFRFFKWTSLGILLRGMGTQWVPFVEWGYLALLAALLQALMASVLLVLLPFCTGAGRDDEGLARGPALVYFAALGLGYMFLEIAFIQRFMLLLAYPIYAVAVVLAAFLFFTGCGSYLFDRFFLGRGGVVGLAVAGIVTVAAAYLLLLPSLFTVAEGWPRAARVGVSLVLLAPLALCLGFPFPAGLQHLSDRAPGWVPWAWCINGCASVLGAMLATLAGMHLGFTGVLLLALLSYSVAWQSFRRLVE